MHGLETIKRLNQHTAGVPLPPTIANLAMGNVYTVIMQEYDGEEHVKDHVIEVTVSDVHRPIAPRGWISRAMFEQLDLQRKRPDDFELIVVLEGGFIVAYKPDEA